MNDPLHRALSDAEASDEAAAYTVPVALVRSRVRRRRAVRAGGVVGVAALAVVAVVVAAPSFLSRTPAADPPAGPAPGVVADWPAQFDRCGRKVDDVLDAKGDVSLGAKVTQGADSALRVETTMTGPADVTGGFVYGTELTVVDASGVVVGVQEGPSVPALADLDDYYAGTEFKVEPLPLTSSSELPLVSCDQYPSGSGDVDLPPGEYQLWVTQTVGLGSEAGSWNARASVQEPIVVGPGHTLQPKDPTPAATLPAPTDPSAASPADELFRCGEPVDVTIHTLPDAGGLTLAADLPETGWGDRVLASAPPIWLPPKWSVTLGAAGGATVHAHGSPAGSIAFVDDSGVVVAFANPSRGPLRTVTVGPDTTQVLDGPTNIRACAGHSFEGTFTAWPFAVETLDGQGSDDGRTVVVVANPRQVTFGP